MTTSADTTITKSNDSKIKKAIQLFKQHLGVLLLLLAVPLLLFTVSLPMWMPTVSGSTTSVDPQIILGLSSFVIAILAATGGAMYVQLRKEVEAHVRSEILGPLKVENHWIFSNMAYLGYLKIWDEAEFPSKMDDNLQFRWLVALASTNARRALEVAESLPEGPEVNKHREESRNSLGFHLATQYRIFGRDEDKKEALELLTNLEFIMRREPEAIETVAWILMNCHAEETEEHKRGRELLDRYLSSSGVSRTSREFVEKRYSSLF